MGEEKIEVNGQNPNTPEELTLLHEIVINQENAESVRGTKYTDSETTIVDQGIEQIWEDEYKMLTGDQWSTSFAYRTKSARKTRPNSVDNFIFPAIINMHAAITANTPEVIVEGQENDKSDGDDDYSAAEKLTHLIKQNDKRNNFRSLWKKITLQGLAYGPYIGAVIWDKDWIGGVGPNRWIGDVRILHVDRRNIFFDPAIIDLEERMQECAFIHRKFRKKLGYIKQSWPEMGQYVSEDTNDIELQDEGTDPGQVWLIEAWNRGKPKMVPEEYRQKYLQKAQELLPPSANVDYYKAQEYKDMAAGILEGVHCAYVANSVFLEYVPYVYDDGLYPFVYKTCYYDENSPHGFGEIRNIKIPQVMHNKADEIEIEAMSREGLGGGYYEEGAIKPDELTQITSNSGKGGMWFKVQSIFKMKEREGAKVPPSVREYKEHKQRMVETISQNTPIQQGMSPGANVPYRAIAELGARSDTRTKGKIEVLEDFLTELNRLRINRFIQFYTEDRYYRIKGGTGIIKGTFNREEAFMAWDREEAINGETGEKEIRIERYVPDFDLNVKVLDERPTDRNYYTNTAFEMFGKQAMDLESLWYTLEEGKFPPKEEVMQRLANQNTAVQLSQMLNKVPPQMQEQVMQMFTQIMQGMVQQMQGQMMSNTGGIQP
jgi:hypothetical protein